MTGDECLRCGGGLGGRKYWLVIGWMVHVDLLFLLDGGCSLCVYSPGRAGGLSDKGSSSSSESLTMIVEQLSFSLAHCSSVGLFCGNDVMMTSLDGWVAILEGLVAYPDSPMSREIVSLGFGVEYSSPSLIASLSLSSRFVAKTRLKCLPRSNKSVPMFSWVLSWWLDVDSFVRFESVSPVQSAEFGTR
jgi:hypothetical protein